VNKTLLMNNPRLTIAALSLFLHKTYPDSDELLRAKICTTDPTVPPSVDARPATPNQAAEPNQGGTVTWRPNRDRNTRKRDNAN
jgi:hypothetical protein